MKICNLLWPLHTKVMRFLWITGLARVLSTSNFVPHQVKT